MIMTSCVADLLFLPFYDINLPFFFKLNYLFMLFFCYKFLMTVLKSLVKFQ